MNENRPVRSWIPVILSLLLIIVVMTVFGACGPKEDGSWMHCHTAQIDTAIAAAILLVIFLAAAMIKNKMIFIILHVVGIVISIAAMLIPGTLVSMCMMDTMRCYAVMQPFVRIMCVLLILSALINLILQVRKK